MNFPSHSFETETDELRDLLDRSMRATLHRLRGVRGLISGWALMGVPAGNEPAVLARLNEDGVLIGRIDWIRGVLHGGVRLELLLRGEAPSVLLAAALGLGTPEEAGERLPASKEPLATVALALWAHCVSDGRESYETPVPVCRMEDGGLVATCDQPRGGLRPGWDERFSALLLSAPTPGEIRFHARLFGPFTEQDAVLAESASEIGESPAR